MAANHTYPLAEIARISGGEIIEVHHNACPAIAEQPGRCTYADTSYRLVISSKRLVSRLTITSTAVRG